MSNIISGVTNWAGGLLSGVAGTKGAEDAAQQAIAQQQAQATALQQQQQTALDQQNKAQQAALDQQKIATQLQQNMAQNLQASQGQATVVAGGTADTSTGGDTTLKRPQGNGHWPVIAAGPQRVSWRPHATFP